MKEERIGVSTVAAAVAVAVILVAAGVGYIELASAGSSDSSSASSTPSPSSTSTSQGTTTTSSSALTSGTGRLIETFAAGNPIFTSEMAINYTMTVRTLGGTPTTPLALTASGPAGLNMTLSPRSITVTTATGPVPVTVTAQPEKSLAPGTYSIEITATGGGAYYNESLSVQVMNYLVVTIGTTFVPQNLTVPVGTTVTWLRLNGPISQYDNGTHNADFGAGSGIPTSPNWAQWQTWSYTFNKAGTYPYLCDFHPWQTGTIIVTP